ncbi:hypothetical protein [Pseudonocardia acidicola]|uniref:Integral membrane protein n=1 Tax=Pseudonocardia acidicola TaxID=2724939 RepID=A0ABX1S512_9PSEU|nr:hypothetical protein [Pseudonocardia acidicola]NMH96611.1 hypothetical protein [Pseudonocardia acidicola]
MTLKTDRDGLAIGPSTAPIGTAAADAGPPGVRGDPAEPATDAGEHPSVRPDRSEPPQELMSSAVANVLGAVLLGALVLGLVCTGLAFKAADDAQQAARAAVAAASSVTAQPVPATADTATLGQWEAPRIPVIGLRMTPNVSVLVLATAAGFVGALVHVLTVFTARRGYGTLGSRFAAWYLATPVTGAALAMLLIAAIRVGLVSGGANGDTGANLFGVLALGAVAGLFARKATDRLALLLGDSAPSVARGATEAGRATRGSNETSATAEQAGTTNFVPPRTQRSGSGPGQGLAGGTP